MVYEIIIVISGTLFSAKQSCHVQNCDFMGSLLFMSKQLVFLQDLVSALLNYLWNGSQACAKMYHVLNHAYS